MKFGLIVDHDFNLLARLIQCVAHGGILCGDVLLERHIQGAGFFHVLGTGHQLADVESGTGDGQQTHGCEHGETTAHVVGDDETLVSLFVGTGAGGSALGVGHSHNHFLRLFLAALSLALLFQQTECEGGLGGRA